MMIILFITNVITNSDWTATQNNSSKDIGKAKADLSSLVFGHGKQI